MKKRHCVQADAVSHITVTGKAGLEPAMPAPKTRALTTWRLPNTFVRLTAPMQANGVLMNRLAPRPYIISDFGTKAATRSTITAGQASLRTHWRPASDFSKPRKDSQLPYVFNLACFSSLMQAYRFFKHGIYNKRTGVCKALT